MDDFYNDLYNEQSNEARSITVLEYLDSLYGEEARYFKIEDIVFQGWNYGYLFNSRG